MKNVIKAMALSAVLLTVVFVLAGCGINGGFGPITIVGKWAYDNNFVYTFNEDGTGSYDSMGTVTEFTYTTDEDKLSIKYLGEEETFDTTYSISGKTLNIKDSFGNDTLYERQ